MSKHHATAPCMVYTGMKDFRLNGIVSSASLRARYDGSRPSAIREKRRSREERGQNNAAPRRV